MDKNLVFALVGIIGSTAGSLSFAKRLPVEQTFALVLAPVVTSCKVQLPSQLIVEYYDKEQKIKHAKYYLVNNKKHGMYLEYYRDGIVKEQTNYLNGVKNGKSIEYNSSGDAVAQTDYLKGAMNKWIGYCANSNTACSEVRMDGNDVSYYSVKEFMRIENSALPYLATKGTAVNGRISGIVTLATQQGPVSMRDAGIGGIPKVSEIEPEAFKRLIALKQEFEAGHRDETCCGFVMVINYSNATMSRDKSAIYYEKYVFNPLAGKINHIDYYKQSGRSYTKVGHQVIE